MELNKSYLLEDEYELTDNKYVKSCEQKNGTTIIKFKDDVPDRKNNLQNFGIHYKIPLYFYYYVKFSKYKYIMSFDFEIPEYVKFRVYDGHKWKSYGTNGKTFRQSVMMDFTSKNKPKIGFDGIKSDDVVKIINPKLIIDEEKDKKKKKQDDEDSDEEKLDEDKKKKQDDEDSDEEEDDDKIYIKEGKEKIVLFIGGNKEQLCDTYKLDTSKITNFSSRINYYMRKCFETYGKEGTNYYVMSLLPESSHLKYLPNIEHLIDISEEHYIDNLNPEEIIGIKNYVHDKIVIVSDKMIPKKKHIDNVFYFETEKDKVDKSSGVINIPYSVDTDIYKIDKTRSEDTLVILIDELCPKNILEQCVNYMVESNRFIKHDETNKKKKKDVQAEKDRAKNKVKIYRCGTKDAELGYDDEFKDNVNNYMVFNKELTSNDKVRFYNMAHIFICTRKISIFELLDLACAGCLIVVPKECDNDRIKVDKYIIDDKIDWVVLREKLNPYQHRGVVSDNSWTNTVAEMIRYIDKN